MKLKLMRTFIFVSKVNMETKTCYSYVLIWIIWKSRMCTCSVPDPCPEIQPSTQVTDMCQAGSAVEDISESNAGNLKYDHVTIRARKQEDNCICRVFIEDQSLVSFTIYIQPLEKLQNSKPKEPECGLELYMGFYDKGILQQNQFTNPIKCTNGQNDRSFSFKRNSELRFTSKVISGNFTRGYCINIQRVHVNGQNGILKIVCGVPGLIPSLNLTTTQSPDYPTGQPSSGSSSSTRKDESTIYIAIGGSAGVLLLVIVVLVIIFYRRNLSNKIIKKPETSTPDTLPTNEHDDPDYNGLKYNMLYVSADHQDVLEGDYHTVDNDQQHMNKKVSEHDLNYSTVDDNITCTSLNTVATLEVVQNAKKGQRYENLEDKEIAKREQNISQEGNGNTYAVVDKRRVTGHINSKKSALSPVYAVVDKTGKIKMENK